MRLGCVSSSVAQPGLEAQISNLADEIAYNNHDVDDGLRAGLLELGALREVPIFARQLLVVEEKYPALTGRRLINEVIRRMIDGIVVDLIECSSRQLQLADPADIEAVRGRDKPLICMGEAMHADHMELKRFLRENLYRHYRVQRMTRKARAVVTELFRAFMEDPLLLPDEHRATTQRLAKEHGDSGRAPGSG